MRPDLTTVWQCICADPNRAFIRSPRGSVNYGRLAGLINRFCGLFDQEGVATGGRIPIVSSNEPVASAAFLAAFLDGQIPVMLSPDSAPERVTSICASLEADLLVADETAADTFRTRNAADVGIFTIPQDTKLEAPGREMISALKGLIRRVKTDKDHTELDLPIDGREPKLPAADENTAYVLFTSGTTQAPSGVQISRKAVMSQMETLSRLFGYDADSRIFNATPLAHTDGLAQYWPWQTALRPTMIISMMRIFLEFCRRLRLCAQTCGRDSKRGLVVLSTTCTA